MMKDLSYLLAFVVVLGLVGLIAGWLEDPASRLVASARQRFLAIRQRSPMVKLLARLVVFVISLGVCRDVQLLGVAVNRVSGQSS
jgi:hypothetical protein